MSEPPIEGPLLGLTFPNRAAAQRWYNQALKLMARFVYWRSRQCVKPRRASEEEHAIRRCACDLFRKALANPEEFDRIKDHVTIEQLYQNFLQAMGAVVVKWKLPRP